MDLFNILKKPEPVHGVEQHGLGGNEGIREPPNSPELSEEQRIQLMQFMEELKEQRTSDPAAFQKTMESLGLGSDGSAGSGDQMGTLKVIYALTVTFVPLFYSVLTLFCPFLSMTL